MIYIDKGEVNSIVLTLTEVSTLSNPYYLFVFENEMDTTDAPILFTTLDISTWKERFNQFILDEPIDVVLVKGQYKYKVYESAIYPPTSIQDTTGVVIEEGRMVVSGVTVNSIYA